MTTVTLRAFHWLASSRDAVQRPAVENCTHLSEKQFSLLKACEQVPNPAHLRESGKTVSVEVASSMHWHGEGRGFIQFRLENLDWFQAKDLIMLSLNGEVKILRIY